jgi:AraC family transcriptional activator FtrA
VNPNIAVRQHRVALVVLESTFALDLAIPVQTFGRAVFTKLRGEATPPYEVMLCGVGSITPDGPLGFTVGELAPVEAIASADTVVVPGLEDPLTAQHPRVLHALAEAGNAGARMISLCAGAFVLGQAGLLAGRRVTTHWALTDAFRATFPEAELEEHVAYVDDGQILSSGGMLAATDLCLHVLRDDLGSGYAEGVARLLIHNPDYGSARPRADPLLAPRPEGSLTPVLAWLAEHLHEHLDLQRIADHAHLSKRTLVRHFRAQTGLSPNEWVARQRLEAARSLLENTDLTVLQVAHSTGFGSTENMRRAFTYRLGVSPRDYRGVVQDRTWSANDFYRTRPASHDVDDGIRRGMDICLDSRGV